MFVIHCASAQSDQFRQPIPPPGPVPTHPLLLYALFVLAAASVQYIPAGVVPPSPAVRAGDRRCWPPLAAAALAAQPPRGGDVRRSCERGKSSLAAARRWGGARRRPRRPRPTPSGPRAVCGTAAARRAQQANNKTENKGKASPPLSASGPAEAARWRAGCMSRGRGRDHHSARHC